jgi:tetratricopeptide (TPR) repeat protein
MFLSSTPPPAEPQSSPRQRILLFTLLVVVVSLPLLVVSLLYAATYVPALDRVTLAMPMSIRSTVAEGVLKQPAAGDRYELKVRRALKLDPSSADALGDLCSIETGGDDLRANAIEDCKRAIDALPSRWNWYRLGRAQEKTGDVCTAAQSYETAHDKGGSGDSGDLSGMGRTELQCGHIPYSIAELSAARDLDAKYAKEDDGEGEADEDLKSDNEWLSAAYSASNQPGEAKEACLLAHPAAKTCACTVSHDKVSCDAPGVNSPK